MKKNLTDLLYREIAGSGDGSTMDRVIELLERRVKGQNLTKQEESVLVAAEKAMGDILYAPQDGYSPEKPKKAPEPPPLPFSSFAEGLARLQRRIEKRGVRPQLKPVTKTGAYRPDRGAKGEAGSHINPAKIAAIVKMAQEERAKLKKR
jgi:hypothetical protein